MNPWYKRSLACGVTPLVLGISIFIGWYFTHASWLEVAGIINIFFGLILFLLGIIFVGIYLFKTRQYKRSLVPLLILLLNFPVATTIISKVEYIKSTCTLKIVNQSPYAITKFYLTERDYRHPVMDTPARSISRQEFHFKYEGTVYYTMQINGKTHQGNMFGYVTSGMSSVATLRLSESGELNVTTKP